MSKWWIHWLGKLVVSLHYKRKLDIYTLCSIHAPHKYKRRYRKLHVPRDVRWAVWRRDNYTCVYCYSRDHPLTIDHLIPESLGGTLEMTNLVSACESCNNKKANKLLDEFLKERWLKKKRIQNRQRLSTTTATQTSKLMTGQKLISRTTGASGS